MLPFLKKKEGQIAGIIMKTRSPDNPEQKENSNSLDGLEACANELISAIHMKDNKKVASALKAAFELLESQEDDESIEPPSYDAQKESE